MSSPATIDSSVLLPEPEAPTMATDSRGASAKSISWSMVRVPVESATCLVTRCTTMMGSDIGFRFAARRAFVVHCSALAAAGRGGACARPCTPRGQGRTLLVVGDSLSAEYGIARGSGWVALLEQRLAQQKLPVQVVNASISGDTTSGGRSRLPALLQQHRPQVVVIALGGNDALRGLPLDMTQANLTAMARAAKAAGAKVLIVGIAVPPNYGRKYGEDFVRLFGTVAEPRARRWCPSCWPAWPTRRTPTSCSSPTASTPRPQAHPRMLDNVWPVLRPLLR